MTATSLTFVLPLSEKSKWQQLLDTIPRTFHQVKGRLEAPEQLAKEPQTAPTSLNIGSLPTQCGIHLLTHETALLSRLDGEGPRQPRQVGINYDQLGADRLWPEAIDYIVRVIWKYSNMGYTGRIIFSSKVWSRGISSCQLILEDWETRANSGEPYPSAIRIDTPDGMEAPDELIKLCREFGLEDLGLDPADRLLPQ